MQNKAELWRFPDRTTSIGQMINSYLSSETEVEDGAIHLLFSANRWEKREQMIEKLHQGVTLVVDRYAFSGVAFTAAKGKPGLDVEWCMASDKGLVAPDVVYFLELTPEEAARRGGFGGERYEIPAFQKAVLEQFDTLKGPHWETIDASGTVDQVHDILKRRTDAIVEGCAGGKPLGFLWDGYNPVGQNTSTTAS